MSEKSNKKLTAEALLFRFVGLYGEVPLVGAMIQPGVMLWRDLYEWSGEHMILTDEGWEPGAAKQSYVDSGHVDAILCELNAPKGKAA